MLVTILLAAIAGGGVAAQTGPSASATHAAPIVVHVFHTATCPHCARALRFLDALAARDDDVTIERIDIADSEANARAFETASRLAGIDQPAVPLILVGHQVVLGYDEEATTGRELAEAISACRARACSDPGAEILRSARAGGSPPALHTSPGVGPKPPSQLPATVALPLFGEVALGALSLPVLTIVLGAVDGFNPCAMWVLVFLVGLLVGMRDPVRMWTYGAVFLLTSGLVYLAFMAAWLNLFLYVGSLWWIRTGVALFALGAAGYYLWQFITNPEGACVATSASQHQRVMARLEALVAERSFLVAIAGLVTLAVAVNMVELVCSAGVPAIYTEVLSHSSLPPLAYYGYLLLYISVFMLDDAIVFVTAMLTLRATGLTASYARYAHLVGAVVLAGLGVIMLLRPEWLALA